MSDDLFNDDLDFQTEESYLNFTSDFGPDGVPGSGDETIDPAVLDAGSDQALANVNDLGLSLDEALGMVPDGGTLDDVFLAGDFDAQGPARAVTPAPDSGGWGSWASSLFGVPDFNPLVNNVSSAFASLSSLNTEDMKNLSGVARTNAQTEVLKSQTELNRTKQARLNDPFYKQQWFWQTVLGFGAMYLQMEEQEERRKQERRLLQMQLDDRAAERQLKYADRAAERSSNAVGVTRGGFTNFS